MRASAGVTPTPAAAARQSQPPPQRPTPHALPARISDGLVSRIAPVMTIMDLEISSDVARRAQQGDLGWETSSLLNLTHLNTAFGYIAQLSAFLSVVLDVPMLYHVVLEGSFCHVQQTVAANAVQTTLPRDISDVRCHHLVHSVLKQGPCDIECMWSHLCITSNMRAAGAC